MNRIKEWALVLPVALAFSAMAHATGGSSTNGGDIIVYRFETARSEAAEKVSLLSLRSLSNASPKIQAFFQSHQAELAADILGTKHVWSEASGFPTCARTATSSKADLSLSIQNCRLADISEAEEILIHESIHHLGIKDEDFAYEASRAILSAQPDNLHADELCRAVTGTWIGRPEDALNSMFPFHATPLVIDLSDCNTMHFHGQHSEGTEFEHLFKNRRSYTQRISNDDVMSSYMTFNAAFRTVEVSFTTIDEDNGTTNPDDRSTGIFLIQPNADSSKITIKGHYFSYDDNGTDPTNRLLSPERRDFSVEYTRAPALR